MSSSKTHKRFMKLTGLLNCAYSGLLLRYTSFQTKNLKGQFPGLKVDHLHVGCGDVHLPGWLNIFYDTRQEYGRFVKSGQAWVLNYDLLKPWPFQNESVNYIAGSHFIEHLDLNAGIIFVQESFRALKKGGVIRLSCPDLEVYARNYVSGNMNFFNHPLIREWCTFKNARTPGEIFVAKAYDSGGSHKWFYDFASLKHILELAGFKDVRRVQRLEGKTPDLDKLEPPLRELETVYVEACK